jgi:hypothetical protein
VSTFIAIGASGIVAVIAISLWIESAWRKASAVIKATEEGQ